MLQSVVCTSLQGQQTDGRVGACPLGQPSPCTRLLLALGFKWPNDICLANPWEITHKWALRHAVRGNWLLESMGAVPAGAKQPHSRGLMPGLSFLLIKEMGNYRLSTLVSLHFTALTPYIQR